MQRQSPIGIDSMEFYAYTRSEAEETDFVGNYCFDKRHDFLVGESFAGICLKAMVYDKRLEGSIGNTMSFTLVDVAERCVVANKNVDLKLDIDDFKYLFVDFKASDYGLLPGHSYKVVVNDETTYETLMVQTIRLLDESAMKHPTEWYDVIDGGVRPEWKDYIYKSLNTVDEHGYYVDFYVAPNFGGKIPAVLPELEIRIHYPDGCSVRVEIKEPFCKNLDNFHDNRWTVSCRFETIADMNGVFYAELLCMEYPIAGFAFDTLYDTNLYGRWCGWEIEPMEEYSPTAAVRRLDQQLFGKVTD